MILTPIDTVRLPEILARFDACLEGTHPGQAVFRRIAATNPTGPIPPAETARHHAQAVALCHAFEMVTCDEEPQQAYSWDGRVVRTRTEPSVLIHEVAHLQCCAPKRITAKDFGLGAGPETGLRELADAEQTLFGASRELEEALTSLLGIIWEAHLGQPALLAFLEQNWLEGVDSPQNRAHFLKCVDLLLAMGLIDADGQPLMSQRCLDDAAYIALAGTDPTDMDDHTTV